MVRSAIAAGGATRARPGAYARSTRDAVNLGREEFIASHRPRVRVSNVAITPVTQQGMFDDFFVPKRLVSGTLYISNVGETTARIVRTHIEVFLTSIPLPMRLPYQGRQGEVTPHLLISGTTKIQQFASEFLLEERQSDDIIKGGNQQIYVMGWVSYEDSAGTLRNTLFSRKYDAGRRRFFPIEDPDYEREE